MNIKQIKEQATDEQTFENGLIFYENGDVQNYLLETSNTINLSAEVSDYLVQANINDNDDLIEYKCICPSFQKNKGCCQHLVALLLTYYYDIDNKQKNINKVKTDIYTAKMLNKYTQKDINNIIINNFQKVHIIPRLHIEYNNKLLLSFMIGLSRLYVLRNLVKFYYDMKENNIVEYGKNLTFHHHINNFTPLSQNLVNFIINTYNEMLYYQDYFYHVRFDERYLLVSPNSFDKFFEIYQGNNLTVVSYQNEQVITLVDAKPELELSIKEDKNDTYLVTINIKDFFIIKGENYYYILSKQKLHRVAKDYYENIYYLIQAFKEKGSALTISSLDMSSFYVNVLERIKNDVKINCDMEILNKYKPIPLNAKLYIDLEENNKVSAQLKFIYDEYEFDVFDDKKVNIYRNIKEELIIKNLMNKYFEYKSKTVKRYFIEENELIINLYYKGIEELNQYMEVYISEQFKKIIKKAPQIKIGLNVKASLLDLEIETDLSIDEIISILNSYRQNKKYYRFKDGSFIYLEDNSISELAQITEGIDYKTASYDNHFYIPKHRSMYIDNILKNSKYIKSERDNKFKEIVRDIKNVDDTQFNVPQTLKNTLRNYQKTGFRWLKTISHYGFGGILADDMGVGKTIQIISLIQSYIDENNKHLPSFVVTPASLVLNWELEFNKFAPNIKVLTIIGSLNERKELIKTINDYQVIITSYDYLKRDIDLYKDVQFMFHIIDEAQYIKNHLTLNAKSVKQIKSSNRFALTGTPIENNLAEIWSIFDFIMPGFLYSYGKFKQEFEEPIIKDENIEVLNKLRRLVNPFILRRLKKDVLKELPDKTEIIMYTNLEGKQKELYQANLSLVRKEVRDKLKRESFNQNRIMILSLLTRLRQICCDPRLYYDDYNAESAKLEMLIELVKNSIESNHKILLFSQFTSMLNLIKNMFIKEGISFYLLDGSTKKEERINLVNKFNTDNTNVFLISLKAGGTGLNLTSADIVIHYDPWWNVSVENQATDRSHRIGQTKKVQVYKLITKNTIEEKILLLQEEKRKLADSIIVEDNGIITRMTEEEILSLFD